MILWELNGHMQSVTDESAEIDMLFERLDVATSELFKCIDDISELRTMTMLIGLEKEKRRVMFGSLYDSFQSIRRRVTDAARLRHHVAHEHQIALFGAFPWPPLDSY